MTAKLGLSYESGPVIDQEGQDEPTLLIVMLNHEKFLQNAEQVLQDDSWDNFPLRPDKELGFVFKRRRKIGSAIFRVARRVR